MTCVGKVGELVLLRTSCLRVIIITCCYVYIYFLSYGFCRHISTLLEISVVIVVQRSEKSALGRVGADVHSQQLLSLSVINMSRRSNEKRNIALYLERCGIFVEVFRWRCNHVCISTVCKVPLQFSTHSRFIEYVHISLQVTLDLLYSLVVC
jgi:hypothetical protein